MVRIKRRSLVLAAGALLAAPLAAPRAAQPEPRAQHAARVHRIGVLWVLPDPDVIKLVKDRLIEGLRRAGYVPGENIEIEWHIVTSPDETLDAAASDLVRKKVDLILALSNHEIVAARRATRTTPIVMMAGVEPVKLGVVRSLAHPGGNVTGAAWHGYETAAKILQILKEANPAATRIALLFNPAFPGNRRGMPTVVRAAPSLGIALELFEVTRTDDIPAALDRIAAYRPDALYLVSDPIIPGKLAASFAVKHKLVSIATIGAFAFLEGGLFSYAPDFDDLLRRAVAYVDRILRGARPGDLPVELPARFLFTVNAKTARAIGYTVPQSLLLRADRVIE